ncbi:MarR family winged helix-turn-helix transcriptional regulator [Chloroflexota bacterium]
MRSDILDVVAEELLTILPLLFRSMRKKLVKTALVDINLDISPLHIEIMKLLEGAGRLSNTEIGEKLQIARAQLTHLIDRLADLAMVERQACKNDRRVIYIALTAKGKSTLELKDSRIRNAFKETLATLTDEELKDISASLSKLRDVFS